MLFFWQKIVDIVDTFPFILLSLPYIPVIWWCFSRCWLPGPPRNSETAHTGHTSTYHAAQTSQGIAIKLWGKIVGSLSLRWRTFERLEMRKKKSWLMCFLLTKWSSPIYKEKLYSHIFQLYVCACLHRNCRMEITELHHPSQIRCEFEGDDLSDGKKCAKKKCHQGDITKVNYTRKIIPNDFLKDKTLIYKCAYIYILYIIVLICIKLY